MRTRSLRAAALLAALLAAPLALAGGTVKKPGFVEGELIVKFTPSATAREQSLSLANHGGQLIRTLGDPSLAHVRLDPSRTVADSLDEYNADQYIEYAQPNFIYHTAATPNTTGLPQEWAIKNTGQTIATATITGLGIPAPVLQRSGNFLYGASNPPGGPTGYDIGAEDTWSINTDCSRVVVAVVDSGVNYNHTDLAPNMWNGPTNGSANCQDGLNPVHGCDFVLGTNTPLDQFGHGTHVAGIIASAGSTSAPPHGVTGVCWTAQVMAIRVLDTTGSGTDAQILAGLNYAVAQGAKVINMSFGGQSLDVAFNSVIFNGELTGTLFVAAAGNNTLDNDVDPFSPCSNTAPNLLCVEALDQNALLASFSNYGKNSVSIGAPGTNILSTFAGVDTVVPDALTGATCTGGDGWTCGQATGTTGMGWGANNGAFYDPPFPAFGSSAYPPGTNDFVWKTYTFSPTAGTVTIMTFDTEIFLRSGDNFNVFASTTTHDPVPSDPTTTGGTEILTVAGNETGNQGGVTTLDISAYVVGASQTSLGFQMTSAAGSSGDFGVGFGFFDFDQLALDTVAPFHYTLDNGTSMASPYTAGLATMLFSFNVANSGFSYGYADVKSEILAGGVAVPSLQGTSSTGKAINALNALTTIAAPQGGWASQ